MQNPITTPIFRKRIRHGAVPVTTGPPTGSMQWTWSGIVAVPTLTTFPAQFTVSGGIATLLTMSLGEIDPPADIGGNTYPYTIDLLIGGNQAASLSIFSNAVVASTTTTFAVSAMTATTPVYPRIYAQPWGGAYDLAITLSYNYAALS